MRKTKEKEILKIEKISIIFKMRCFATVC